MDSKKKKELELWAAKIRKHKLEINKIGLNYMKFETNTKSNKKP